jgi:putative ABC transport system substrate-binding protein
MRRREFIVAGALAPTFVASAQQKLVATIGYMSGGSATFYAGIVPAFRDGLREAGYVEGENVRIDYRWAEGHYDRLPEIAAEFVRRDVDLICRNRRRLGVASGKGSDIDDPDRLHLRQ